MVAIVKTSYGEAELPAGLEAASLGVFRLSDDTVPNPLASVEEQVVVVRPGLRPLLLFDAGLPLDDFSLLAGLQEPGAAELLAVRVRATRSCKAIRARLSAAGLRPVVVDASTVLDEGDALDVAKVVDAVRLARVGMRMRCAGFPVVAIVHDGSHSPRTTGLEAVTAAQAATRPWRIEAPITGSQSIGSRLEATTGAPLITGNRVELEFDNSRARHWLLDAIAASRERFHFQVYMGLDDEVGSAVEAALAAAGARGVAVRVLVDSLHGFQGSYGIRNPVFDRLSKRPGVELRVLRPLTGVPSLEDLKRRDHRRELAIADGAVGLIGGRNLSHEYYTGFEEVQRPRPRRRGARSRGSTGAPGSRALSSARLTAPFWSPGPRRRWDVRDRRPSTSW